MNINSKNGSTNMIECHAQDYWTISKLWNGQIKVGFAITTSDAIKRLKYILNNTNPIRPVAQVAQDLLQDIIHNAKG